MKYSGLNFLSNIRKVGSVRKTKFDMNVFTLEVTGRRFLHKSKHINVLRKAYLFNETTLNIFHNPVS